MRLRGGDSDASGRVEVSWLGEWVTMCDDGFDDVDASVVCRELG